MERVPGVGGIFFKAGDPEALKDWYAEHLGIATRPDGTIMFQWRELDDPEQIGYTVWGPFPKDTKYFDPSTSPFMFNFRVAELDALLKALRQEGVEVDDHTEDYPYGRFGWIMDPEGNRVELWEPSGATDTGRAGADD
ncbi:MAG: VOC family protein [Anaerolineae bacterium]